MIKNKRVSDVERDGYQQRSGRPYPEFRNSGRTTACCLKAIADAMVTPGSKIRIQDHDSFGIGTGYLDYMMTRKISGILHVLGLEHFEIIQQQNIWFIIYNIFGDADE